MIQSGCAVLYLLYVLIDLENKNGEPSVTKGTIEYVISTSSSLEKIFIAY